VQGDDVALTALKKTEDGDGLLLRFYEWAGKSGNVTLTVPSGAKAATVTNLMETPEGQPLAIAGDHVTVPVSPYQIQSVRIDYAPAASQTGTP
jgi:alpha-mannosidase